MNLYKRFIFVGVAMLVSLTAFASSDPATTLPWLGGIIAFLQSIPAVGAVLAKVFEIMAILAVVLTALAAFLDAMKVALAGSARLVGLENLATHIEDLLNKVIPWVKYLSMYNVQKPQ